MTNEAMLDQKLFLSNSRPKLKGLSPAKNESSSAFALGFILVGSSCGLLLLQHNSSTAKAISTTLLGLHGHIVTESLPQSVTSTYNGFGAIDLSLLIQVWVTQGDLDALSVCFFYEGVAKSLATGPTNHPGSTLAL